MTITHTYKRKNDKWEVGYYAPETWVNPLFGPRTVYEWQIITQVSTEQEARDLVAKLNGGE